MEEAQVSIYADFSAQEAEVSAMQQEVAAPEAAEIKKEIKQMGQEAESSTAAPEEAIKRFSPQVEADLIKALSKILSTADGIPEEKAIKLSSFGIMTPCNVAMICAKTQEAKRVLSRFVETSLHYDIEKIPTLDYGSITGKAATSKYSTEYLLKFMAICKVCQKAGEEAVSISVNGDYPTTWENTHFKMILAPRVDND